MQINTHLRRRGGYPPPASDGTDGGNDEVTPLPSVDRRARAESLRLDRARRDAARRAVHREHRRLPYRLPVRAYRDDAARRRPDGWCRPPVTPSQGWDGVHAERLWVRGRPA